MAKDNEQIKDDLQQQASAKEPQQETTAEELQHEEQTTANDQQESLTTLEKMKRQAKEGDEAPSSSLRFKDILGGDYLWALVRNQIWLIMLIVLITIAYIAVRYQCQQDAIDISQLEKNLVDAKFQALSSSSNLTRMCRQSNVVDMLKEDGDSLLHISQQPPYIIEVPEN